MAELLQINNLTVHYQRKAPAILHNVSLAIRAGETLALVGPSGCGKSTLARSLLRLIPVSQGTIFFGGDDWLQLRGRRLRQHRAAMQMVFQDPLAAFNPRALVAEVMDDPLRIHLGLNRAERAAIIATWLQRLGLPDQLAQKRMDAISGGQRQRVALARALCLKPKLLVLDEAVSALDASTKREIVALLRQVQADTGCALLFISHDLAIAAQLADHIAVMQNGAIAETAPCRQLLAAPGTAISKAMIDAVPRLRFDRD